jgi:hypothetical protein
LSILDLLNDLFRRKPKRGVRDELRHERESHQATERIARDPRDIPAPRPRQAQPHPPVKVPAPTMVMPRVAPPQPQPSPPTPPRDPVPSYSGDAEEKTKIVGVPGVFKSRVVGVLVAIEGECEGEVYKLCDGENMIGRTKDCQVQIPSQYISRPHALLIHKDGMFAIRPLSTENPTFVNDDRVMEVQQLSDGASIKVGRTTFRFRSIA